MPLIPKTREQLLQGRWLTLDITPQPRPRSEIWRDRVNPEKAVGKLEEKVVEGKARVIYIEMTKEYWMGRSTACQVIYQELHVSHFHLRLYAAQTTTKLSICCVHVLATNGVIINGKLWQASDVARIGGREVKRRIFVLRQGDEISIPATGTVWTYGHNNRHHTADTLSYASALGSGQVPSLFRSSAMDQAMMLPRWRVLNLPLGTGSFGVVYLATHVETGLQAACKTVATRSHPNLQSRLLMEVNILKQLDHPNILAILDFIQEETDAKRMHLILDLVTGGDFFSYLHLYFSLTEPEVQFAAYQLVKGLAYLHENGVVHRDFKIENILLMTSTAFPRLVIADFGMAQTYDSILRSVGRGDQPTSFRAEERGGTICNLPPERLHAMTYGSSREAAEDFDGQEFRNKEKREAIAELWFVEEVQLDLWGLGVLLYFVAMGKHPYAISNDSDISEYWDKSMQEAEEREPPVDVSTTWRVMYRWAEDFSHLSRLKWEPVESWTSFSKNGRDFIRGLMMAQPERRMSMAQALFHPWLLDDGGLKKLYERNVINGQVSTPAEKRRVRRPAHSQQYQESQQCQDAQQQQESQQVSRIEDSFELETDSAYSRKIGGRSREEQRRAASPVADESLIESFSIPLANDGDRSEQVDVDEDDLSVESASGKKRKMQPAVEQKGKAKARMHAQDYSLK